MSSLPSSSNDWRRLGYEKYKQAGECSSLVDAASLLKEAIRLYESAFKTATNDEEKCFALRDVGKANYDLGQNCLNRARIAKQEIQSRGMYSSSVHYKEAGIAFGQSRDLYNQLSEILKRIEDEQVRKEEEELRKNRESFLQRLSNELDDLMKLSEKSAEHLLKELIQTFEPKHRIGTKALEELSQAEFTHKTPRSDIKKALSKLILLYHPDRVDVRVHGAKYHVLCEEITKVITRKFEVFNSLPSSNDWRRFGNEKYKKAGESWRTLVDASNLLKEAIRAYESAFNTATNDEEKCFALRYLGMANWRLGRNCENRTMFAVQEKQADGSTYYYNSSHRTEYNPHFMLHFYKEAISAISRCRPFIHGYTQTHLVNIGIAGDGAVGRKTPDEFVDQLNENMKECALEALKFLTNMYYFSTYKTRIAQIEYLIKACDDRYHDDLSAVFHLEKAKTYHKWAITELERSKDFKMALNCLKECYYPLETIRRLCPATMAFNNFTLEHQKETEDLFKSIQVDASTAEAMRLIDQGDNRLRSAIFDDESIDFDNVYDALLDYRSALTTLRDADHSELLLEAEAYAKMGRIYFELLKNEVRAKTFCMEAVQLTVFMTHPNFSGRDWFDKAKEILKHMQDEQLRKETEALRRDREPFLKELVKELDDLKKLAEKSSEVLLKELIKTFEPKHRIGTKALEELSQGEYSHETPRSDIKKALCKLILLYHPDHVDVQVHGAKYHVLCEEITKVITRKYECLRFATAD